ncbi:hypothetical protein JCM15765_12590 [Paradesulfitobacterium aromaticivorans]
MSRPGHHHLCHTDCHTPERLAELRLAVSKTEGVTPIFKALADETRVKIIYALLQEPDLCVCDLADIASLTVAAASHHLRLLKNMGLARSRKDGKLVRYSLSDEHVKSILEEALPCNTVLTSAPSPSTRDSPFFSPLHSNTYFIVRVWRGSDGKTANWDTRQKTEMGLLGHPDYSGCRGDWRQLSQ